MSFWKCNTCGGEYEDADPRGTRYCHVCPPVLEYRDRTGAVLTAEQAALLREQGQVVRERTITRPNARDENVDRDKAAAARDAGGVRRRGVTDEDLIRAPGAGRARATRRDAV